MAGTAPFLVAGRASLAPERRAGRRTRLDSLGAARLGSAMAAPMIPPVHAPDFLAAHGWEGAEIRPLAGDASFRRYFRIHGADGARAVLMDAPPPHEDPRPFVAAATWLAGSGLSAPSILGHDLGRGLLLIDDFGDARLRETLDEDPGREAELYAV